MIEIRFGYLQESAVIDWVVGTIRPLDDIASIVEHMQADANSYGGWFYPRLKPIPHDSSEAIKVRPLVPMGFSLPATHLLLFKNHGWTDEGANFVIALFGMLKGRRLQRDGWQHFYKAPIDRKLCDFYATDQEISHALDRASNFWLTHTDSDTRKLAFGALHWHLFAQLYQHEFERFNAQYMALDACYKLADKTWPDFPHNYLTHAERPSVLCDQIGVPIPAWANIRTVGKKKICELAVRRNALIHEAMYGDQAVGFSHPKIYSAMELELTGLVARILLRLLGIDNEYTRSECTTGATFGFS
jgi:hypothetical protein